MKKVKLFLASSLHGLDDDKLALGAFVGDLNDRYEPYGLYFQLIMDEGDVEGCDLFYIIFHADAHGQALEQFETAYARYKSTSKPKVITYFKKIEQARQGQSVMDFISRLDRELGHYYSFYSKIDTLKLNMLLQIKSLNLVETQMEIKDNELHVQGKPLMTLDNLPIMLNNKNLATLKSERADAEREYWTQRENVRQNPDDDDSLMAFSEARFCQQ
ncbi:MAG: hypothetical protein FWB74_04515 [Defluviitaleaceae bacterium]|nr:hypothetical protein [Defluviitaleaceae bacterium]